MSSQLNPSTEAMVTREEAQVLANTWFPREGCNCQTCEAGRVIRRFESTILSLYTQLDTERTRAEKAEADLRARND